MATQARREVASAQSFPWARRVSERMIGRIRLWGAYSGFGLIIAILALAADQLNKYWMIEIYELGNRGRVAVTSYLDLVMLWNPGISFGQLPQDGDLGRYFLIGFSLVAAIALTVYLAYAHSRLIAASVGLIIGGAIGNMIDRIVHGAVADFFSFHYAGYYWYVFNIADVAITLGVFGLLIDWIAPGHTKVSKSV
jgi:signal peptidase II